MNNIKMIRDIKKHTDDIININTEISEVKKKHTDDINEVNSQLDNMAKKNNRNLRTCPKYFGWTGKKLVAPTNYGADMDKWKCGEPFVVWDNDNNVWRMFYFGYNGSVFVLSATSQDLVTWTKKNTNLANDGSTNRHKLAILVDEFGFPKKINNKYHGYVVSKAPKTIYHWETDNLANKWTETGAVISPNFAGDGSDGYSCDAPCAVWDSENEKVILFYMAQPYNSQADFGYGHRCNRAISNAPDGGFVFDTCVLTPSTKSTSYMYGYIGGIQVLKQSNGYIVAFNAGKVRPTARGNEDNPSAIGFGYMDTLHSKIIPNTIAALELQTGITNTTIYTDIGSIWRPNICYNHFTDTYKLFYNTGDAGGDEWVTYANERSLSYEFQDSLISGFTSSEVTIPNAKNLLPEGIYRVKYRVELYGGTSGTNVLFKARIYLKDSLNNIINYNDTLLGGYNYESTQINIEGIVEILPTQSNFVYLTIQGIEGTRTDVKLKNIQCIIEKI